MHHQPLEPILRHIRKLAGGNTAADNLDRTLLERFADERDETAFAALVQRHGPMVLGVCRRVLGRSHDAEDAFQATFLVLVRKASALDRRGTLANWLYTVARHAALRARAQASRRRECERQTMNAEPSGLTGDNNDWQDVRPIIDEELERLPGKYRAPLVLCYLQGRTELEAANELGLPRGTLSSQLSRARHLLHDRLTRRGVALSVGVVGSVLAECAAPAAVPGDVVEQTLTMARVMLETGAVTSTGLASAPVANLTEGVVKAMFISKPKLATVLAASVLLAGTGLLAYRVWAAKPAEEPQAPSQGAITTEQFTKFHAMIKPRPGDYAWREEIPWLISIQEAREQAAAKGKPILLWAAADGHPCGSC